MFLFLASAWVSLRQVATIGNQQILFTLLIAPYYTMYIYSIQYILQYSMIQKILEDFKHKYTKIPQFSLQRVSYDQVSIFLDK